jgi:hypothetical protein
MKSSSRAPILLSRVPCFSALAVSLVPFAGIADSKLEEEMFGGNSSSTPATTTPTPSTSTNLPSPTPAVETNKSAPASEQLTLGGRLELQFLGSKTTSQNIGDAQFLQSSKAELYLDSRPTDELRGFVKGTLSNNGATSAAPAISVSETWIKWSGRGGLFTTLGKQKLKWGAATFWNPTDFLAVQPKDPFAPVDVRPGANLLKLHMPFEKSGNNLYLLADFENATKSNDPRVAGRAEFNFALAGLSGELTSTVAGGRKKPLQLGLDLNTSAGPVDLVVESAWTHKSNRDFYRRITAADGSTDVEAFSRNSETIGQVVAGLRYDLKYSESDSANLSIEYFWNDFGADDSIIEAVSFLRGQSQRLYLAKKYLGTSLVLLQPGSFNDSSIIFSGLWNLTDKSWFSRAAWTEKLNVKSNLILAVTRAGGLGEFRGGIPSSVAAEIRKSGRLGDLGTTLNTLEGLSQEWTLSATAGIDL